MIELRIKEIFDKSIKDKTATPYAPNIIRLAAEDGPDRYGILQYRESWTEIMVNKVRVPNFKESDWIDVEVEQ